MSSRFDVPALLAELTVEEKAALVSGSGFWWTRKVGRVGIPSIMVSDGPHGLRKQDRAGDHVGIGGSVPATCFPTAVGPGLVVGRRPGAAGGRGHRRARPGPRTWPWCSGRASTSSGRRCAAATSSTCPRTRCWRASSAPPWSTGIQSQGVGTSLKHYAVNNQEADRLRGQRRRRRAARCARSTSPASSGWCTQAQPWTVMCSYNRINGVYASQDPWLLTEVLRDEWGFDGLVVSDWGAVDDPVAAVAAGLDLEMPSTGGASAARIVAAVQDGDARRGRARPGRSTGCSSSLDRALPGGRERTTPSTSTPTTRSPASVAAECVVLLKNDGGAAAARRRPEARSR